MNIQEAQKLCTEINEAASKLNDLINKSLDCDCVCVSMNVQRGERWPLKLMSMIIPAKCEQS